MIVYRFAQKNFASDISGTGAKLYGGRWNRQGLPVLYSSEYISLALLEVLVNAVSISFLNTLQLVEIQIPADHEPKQLKLSSLKTKWFDDLDYCQWLGSQMLQESDSLLIKCPSAIIHQENNLLINPLHKDFKKVKVRKAEDFYFDPRLFK
jgi:RES domain-containing protein